MRTPLARAAAFLAFVLAAPALADEGMWTFDNPPAKLLKERYGFEPTQAWLDAVRLASVRFMDGGSGSFVSPDGLMLTNHHVGFGCIQNVSSAENEPARVTRSTSSRRSRT
jgi:S1-C subfamily serine protease